MAVKTYGSANSQARQILDFYGSANSQSKVIEKLYGSVETPTSTIIGVEGEVRPGGEGNVTGFNGATFWAKAHTQINPSKTPSFLWIEVRDQYESIFFDIVYTDSSYDRLLDQTHTLSELAEYGITASYVGEGEDYIDLTPIYATEQKTKLIHQGYGHLNYYGTVAYYTDSNHTDIATQTLHSAQNIRGLSGYSHQTRLTWSVTINGVSISNKDIYGVTLTEKLKALPSYFLSGCSALNSDLILPSSLIAINDSGEQNGSAFLYRCDGMTATVNVGNLPTSIVRSITDASFSTGSNSSAAAFTQGIKIAGTNRAAWLAAFPNRSSYTPYRKLVDAGY